MQILSINFIKHLMQLILTALMIECVINYHLITLTYNLCVTQIFLIQWYLFLNPKQPRYEHPFQLCFFSFVSELTPVNTFT